MHGEDKTNDFIGDWEEATGCKQTEHFGTRSSYLALHSGGDDENDDDDDDDHNDTGQKASEMRQRHACTTTIPN
jgi:hypothetical protein